MSQRFESQGDLVMRDLARYYHHYFARILTSFQDRFDCNVIGAIKQLQDEGIHPGFDIRCHPWLSTAPLAGFLHLRSVANRRAVLSAAFRH